MTDHLDRKHRTEQGHDHSNHDQEKSKNSSHFNLPQQVKHATGLRAGELQERMVFSEAYSSQTWMTMPVHTRESGADRAVEGRR